MGINAIFDADTWARVPFHLWSAMFFMFGATVGSFLNVCIYRMPRGESIVSPPSHCPHCNYSIPWYLNIPLFTWLYLRCKCRNCGAPIASRYFQVELLTGLLFMVAWLVAGPVSAWLAIVYCIILAGLIVASFIDLEHFIIPDEITFGGIALGFICSVLVPALHGTASRPAAAWASLLGMVGGGGLIYLVVRGGKLFFGRHRLELEAGSRVIFTDTTLVLPGQEIAYEELFYRKSDTIRLEAARLELCDRGYQDVSVRLSLISSPPRLMIDDEVLNPEEVPYLEVTTSRLDLPREAMGLGDVKFMAAIGAFLGWRATFFSLGISSLVGSVVGVMLIGLGKRDRSARMQFGPFIAVAAVVWMFGGHKWWDWVFGSR